MTDIEKTPERLAHDLALVLMYLSSWTERGYTARRFWKGFDFDLLKELEAEELIEGSRGAKSAYLTDAGVQRAQQFLAQFAQTGRATQRHRAALRRRRSAVAF